MLQNEAVDTGEVSVHSQGCAAYDGRICWCGKIGAGEFSLHMETVNICELGQEEILNYYQKVEDAKLQMEIVIPVESVYVKSDVTALKLIRSYLIGNAITYGSEGWYLKVKVYHQQGT